MTEIYIVRHGETDANIRFESLGHRDVPLNERGREQVRFLSERLRDIEFDAVYVSPLSRALDTAEPLAKRAKLIMSYGLIERDFGDWDGMTFDEISQAFPELYREWQDNWIDFQIPNGESSAAVQKRVNETVDKILADHKDKKVLIVTHLGTARHILSHLLGLTPEQSWLFAVDNAKTAIVQINDKKAVLKSLNI